MWHLIRVRYISHVPKNRTGNIRTHICTHKHMHTHLQTHTLTRIWFIFKPGACQPLAGAYLVSYYRIVGFCHEDFNVASHGIRNIKIHYISYLVTFYHVRFCNWLVLCLYFSISLKSKWGLFQTLKEHYLMHESIRNSIVSAIGIY